LKKRRKEVFSDPGREKEIGQRLSLFGARKEKPGGDEFGENWKRKKEVLAGSLFPMSGGKEKRRS